jgi:hypothetical protein
VSGGPDFIGSGAKARQRRALLVALKAGPVSTIAARDSLGISHPAGRVFELRRLGHGIATTKATILDAAGRPHPCAVYGLSLKGTQ